MINFIKKLFGTERNITESDAIAGDQVTGEEKKDDDTADRQAVELKLSLHPDWSVEKETLSHTEKEIMEKEVAALPPVKEGDVAISGIYAIKTEQLEVGFYICNGLSRPIRFEKVPLVITNLNNEVLASGVFDLSSMGDIPAHSARPWEVTFNKEAIFAAEVKHDDWKIAFNMQPQVKEDVKIEWEKMPEHFTERQRAFLDEYLAKLPALKPGELNIAALQAKVDEQGRLLATVVIRNNGNRAVKIEKLPLGLKDAKQREVATGFFNIDNLVVSQHKARLWTFAFPKETITVPDVDLSRWAVYLKNN